jgi:hypothetical protein
MLQFMLRAVHSRRLALALACALSAALVGATAAQATVTTTTITSPSDPFFGFDQGQTQNVTISGTSDGNASDSVDILCYNDNGSDGNRTGTVISGVSVDSSGDFSTSVALDQLEAGGNLETCRLRAVPHGTEPTTGLTSFAGPRVAVGYLDTTTRGSSLIDYYLFSPQLTGADDYDSYSSCGLDNSYLDDPSITGQEDLNGFYCNDYVDSPSASDSARPGIEVDGQPAYGPYSANNKNNAASGLPALTINSITQNASNGDLTIVETDPIVTCNSGCTAFSPSGVQVQRTITQTDDGHIVYIDDAYSSTDGSSHTVNLLLENEQDFMPPSTTPVPSDISYEFPGESTFAPHANGATVSATANAPASILVENNAQPDGSTSGGRGAITYGQPVTAPFAFGTYVNSASTFDAANAFTVPASGSVPLRYAYSTEYTSAAAQQDAYTAEDKFQAAMIAISSPASGSTLTSSPVTVTGTASAGSGVKSVTVNGVVATVSGGSFSASVPLSKGANALTAVVTSNGGASGSASETVTYTPPAGSVAPVAQAGSAKQVKTTSAELTGTVTPGGASTTSRFEYGKSTSYGKTTSTVTLAASGSASSVSATVKGLAANTTYHFRLVASSSAGSSSSQDVKFRTAKLSPKRVSDSVTPRADHSAPYVYKLGGSIVLPAHVSKKSGCAGSVSVTVKLGKHKVAGRRLRVNRRCKFSGTASFSAHKLKDSGKLSFGFRFTGNRVLAARGGRSRQVSFG